MILEAAFACLAALALAWAGTGGALRFLRSRRVLDRPNPRSSHRTPTPRGAGLAVVPVVAIGWALAAEGVGPPEFALRVGALAALAVALGAVSFLDDLGGLSPLLRLALQAAAIAAMLAVFPFPGPVLGGIAPPWADRLIAGLAWLWFVNLFNFMDGIDGQAAIEILSLGVGAAAVAAIAGLGGATQLMGWIAAGAGLGFLVWNRPPARIFLGDVGSVPLGFLLGWLLLELAAAGHPVPALVLPLYYLADATLTLLRRALRGEKIWRAHREHFYQRATRRGASHGAVCRVVLFANAAFIAIAALAAQGAVSAGVALGAAAGAVVSLLLRLAFWPERPDSAA